MSDVSGSLFGAYDGDYVSVFENVIFAYSVFFAGFYGANEVITEFGVDDVGELSSGCPVGYDVGIGEHFAFVVAKSLYVFYWVDNYTVQEFEVSCVYGFLDACGAEGC